VIDPTEDYLQLMASLFDLEALRALLSRPDMSFVFDGMHGVAGPYAHAIFGEILGVPREALLNCEPSQDFGGGHPDPNLTYAAALARRMGLSGPTEEEPPVLGAAADGDADRNMIVGSRFFVTPSDSVAIIAAHAHVLPWLVRAGGLKALARSMPTSGALDRVAAELGLPLFETPTGWKYFGNLMDSHLLGGANLSPLLCGEESFGTGSSHLREKDGLWAVLCWLSILAHHNAGTPHGQLVGVAEVVAQHWRRFGRNFYTRYDYEGVDSAAAADLVERLRAMGQSFSEAGFGPSNPQPLLDGFSLATIDEFAYTDTVDGSMALKQGVRLLFADGSRIIVRLSGTGSEGATVRIYIERYQRPGSDKALLADATTALAPLVSLALKVTMVRELTGRDEPTVIT
jgi:phosphoglucomutase